MNAFTGYTPSRRCFVKGGLTRLPEEAQFFCKRLLPVGSVKQTAPSGFEEAAAR